MGRHRKYITPEDKKKADAEKALRYYWRNKEACDKRAKDSYWKKKTGNVQVTSSIDPQDQMVSNIIESIENANK